MTYSMQCHFEAIELVVLDDLKIEKVKGLQCVKCKLITFVVTSIYNCHQFNSFKFYEIMFVQIFLKQYKNEEIGNTSLFKDILLIEFRYVMHQKRKTK